MSSLVLDKRESHHHDLPTPPDWVRPRTGDIELGSIWQCDCSQYFILKYFFNGDNIAGNYWKPISKFHAKRKIRQ